ncbi:MAG: response regulator transcription factor [Muribaculaceae bacterium]|nr:response regulator transcription factor [Muribaculaceae bacterium]MDE6681819.1 response regulator transcription factor [Muribaculaceae bacterium]
MQETKIHIAIAENAPIVSAGLTHTVGRLPGMPIRVTEVTSAENLFDYLNTSSPDILIINPYFGETSDIARVRTSYPNLKIAAVAIAPLDRKKMENFDDVISIADDTETICDKIKRMAAKPDSLPESKEPLSNREKEIISLVVKGMTNKEIADKLFLSVHTVITHRRNIARKLEIHSATGLTIYAIVNKLVDISELHL